VSDLLCAQAVMHDDRPYAVIVERDEDSIGQHLTPGHPNDEGIDPGVMSDLRTCAEAGDCYWVLAYDQDGKLADSLADMCGYGSPWKAAEHFLEFEFSPEVVA
jgi:hypothetical protein